MEHMTIGQRIASRRKLANLSQESLGEQLGVSRQSISKWESDAGLPDIDNLIALSKIFKVSVGWILGTEKDPNFDPSTGLSDAQLRMVEKIVSKRKPKRWHRWLNAAVAICILLQCMFFSWQIFYIKRDATAKQQQISALKQQIDSTNIILSQQKYENALLLNVGTKAYLNDDEQTVTIDFYLTPKLYQEHARAYIVIQNSNFYNDRMQLECRHTGTLYHCRAELPVQNGYRYSFVLAGDSGFQEQPLYQEGFIHYLQNLYDTTRYHLDASAPTRTDWSLKDSVYTFNLPIDSPFVCFKGSYVGYEEVEAILYHNDVPIHTQSLRQALYDHGGAYMRSEEPFVPDIRAELPSLSVGDTLRLEIHAKCYNGKTLTNVLEELEIVAV